MRKNRERWRRRGDLKGRISPARIHPGQGRGRNSSRDPPGTGEREEFQPGSTRDGREGEEFQPGSTRDRREGGIPAGIHPGKRRGGGIPAGIHPGKRKGRGIPAGIHPGQEKGRNSSRDPPGTGEREEFQPGSTRDGREGEEFQPGSTREKGKGEEFQPGSTRDRRRGGIPAGIHPGQERGGGIPARIHPGRERERNSSRDPPRTGEERSRGEEFQPGSTRDRREGGIPAGIHPGRERGRNSSPDPPGTGEERSRGNSSRDPPGRAALERGKLEDLLQDLKNELEKRQQKKNPEVSRADTAAQGQGEKNQQPDVKSSISRCGKVTFQLPLDAAAGLEERVCHFSWRSSALKETLRKLRAAVTLDPATAHPELELSPDGKRVRRGPARALPDSPERFDYWPFVLGQQRFSAGRHCWDVDVGEGGDWAVGVARESVRRKGRLSLGPQGGIWGLERWGGQLRALTARKATPLAPPRPPLAPRWPPRRVSVHLDCAGGSVAFLDAEGGGVLFVFSRVAFGGEGLRPWLWVVGAGSQLRLCP